MTLSVHVEKALGAFRLDARFEAPEGITVLFGRSGSGKTTIVNAVAGLLTPDAGRIAVNGATLYDGTVNLPPHRRRIGYVFQDARLFPHMTVHQNLTYGLRARKSAQPFDPVVEMLGICALLGRRPATLSGGEKQRVAIGRALLSDPAILLADEPLAALDSDRKSDILPYFERLRDETGLPILYVTHSVEEAARLATTVVALDNGRVTHHGPAGAVLGDPNFAPAGVRAVGAILNARITAHHDDGLTELDAGGAPLLLPRIDQPVGHALRVRIPAQDVTLSLDRPTRISALNVIAGTVQDIRMGDGPGAIVSLATPAGTVLARVTRRSVTALGLTRGLPCHAILKTVAIAPADVGA